MRTVQCDEMCGAMSREDRIVELEFIHAIFGISDIKDTRQQNRLTNRRVN